LVASVEAAVPVLPPPTEMNLSDILVPPPARRDLKVRRAAERDWRRTARKYDFEVRDEKIRKLGRAGEEFVYRHEKARLKLAGQNDLASRVEWVTETTGDGAGFDVLSFDDQRREAYIEVKTTNFDRYQPFLITRGEISFSSRHAAQYSLFRLFHFASKPRLFRLDGSVDRSVNLEPLVFEGRL
jgi:hypothetical protein